MFVIYTIDWLVSHWWLILIIIGMIGAIFVFIKQKQRTD